MGTTVANTFCAILTQPRIWLCMAQHGLLPPFLAELSPAPRRVPVAGVSNFVKLPSNDYASLMSALATVGPISISVDASWGAYEKGVYMGCSKNKTVIDHAVQAVGYGTENGQDYFLVRNSWGATWGEKGYARMIRGKNACGLANAASYPTDA